MQRTHDQQARPPRNARGQKSAFRGHRPLYPSNVPNINQVAPGVAVSIILKADQSTGREVQGFVAEVLTNGNHPRGIKVRFVDGRVGRVQRLIDEEEARTSSANLGKNGDMSTPHSSHRFQDIRNEQALPPSSYTLSDLLPASHPLNQATQKAVKIEPSTHVCPVCEDFTGDEMAVSYHVNTHFD